MVFRRWVAIILLCLISHSALPNTIDHPIVYVRYPRVGPNPGQDGSGLYGNLYDDKMFDYANDGVKAYDHLCYAEPGGSGAPACPSDYHVTQEPPLPDASHLYRVGEGGDLILLRPDGSKRVLVDHDESKPAGQAVGSIMDTAISPDGEWVAYAEIKNARLDDPYALEGGESRIDIYKMYVGDEADARFGKAVCLTCSFNYRFDRFHDYAPTLDDSIDDNGREHGIRAVAHVAPLWLPDKRIVFMSTMEAEAVSGIGNHYEEKTDFFSSPEMEPASKPCIMDDDGTNLHCIGPSILGRAQHPTLLKDGRIAFTSWAMAFRRRIHNGFSLMQMYPDGTAYQQFAGRHQRMSNSLHFITGLPDGDFCGAQYYNGQSVGFGSILCFPGDPAGLDFTDDGDEAYADFDDLLGISLYGGILTSEWRTDDGDFTFYFDILNRQERVGSRYLTRHMSNFDESTPDGSGRMTQLSPGLDGDALAVWSPGFINESENGAYPKHSLPEVDAGIYVIPDTSQAIEDPWTELEPVVNDIRYNEMWPRVLAPLEDIFTEGIRFPEPPQEEEGPFGYLQAASIRTRLIDSDCIDTAKGADAISDRDTSCYWHTQGVAAGTVKDEDQVGMRILAVVPQPISKCFEPDFPSKQSYQCYNKGYYSPAFDKIYILGEFSTLKRDGDGNLILNREDEGTSGTAQPDTSYVVKVPADVALFQQSLDKDGLSTATETEWHHARPGERKTCVGCHMKTQETPVFSHSAAGQNPDLHEIDVALETPLFTGETDEKGDPIVSLDETRRMVGVEFTRDIGPILQNRCASCHSGSSAKGGLRLDQSIESYKQLAYPDASDDYKIPQVSKWVRMMQARQSSLAWYAYGKRLDGRPDSGDPVSRGGFDWIFAPSGDHFRKDGSPLMSGEERLTLARWIDIGVPISLETFYAASGQDAATVAWKTRRSYLKDDLPPRISMAGIKEPNPVCAVGDITVGFWDDDAIDPTSFKVTVDGGPNLATPPAPEDVAQAIALDLHSGTHAIRVQVADATGNKRDETWDVKIDPDRCDTVYGEKSETGSEDEGGSSAGDGENAEEDGETSEDDREDSDGQDPGTASSGGGSLPGSPLSSALRTQGGCSLNAR